MSLISVAIALIISGVVSGYPNGEINGFTFIGATQDTSYFLSNINDKREVRNARTGCYDSFHKSALVDIENIREHNDIRRLLSTWGIEEDDRVWTTGQHDGDKWVWYDFDNNVVVPIVNVDSQPWVNGITPTSGCLAIGGRYLTFRWQGDSCNARRRYLCKLKEV